MATVDTRFIYNDRLNGKRVSYELTQLLNNCVSFDFSVAFINREAIMMLKNTLLALKNKGVKGRIVTSTYLGFNDPKMFEELLKLDFLDIRIYQENGFHPKGYIFNNEEDTKVIVGSANLTSSALAINQEWNVYVEKELNDPFIQELTDEFDKQYNASVPLTHEWLENYKKVYVKPETHHVPKVLDKEIKPNIMQQEALDSLNSLRVNDAKEAILISATGTGKTYLAAFDVKAFNPKKALFVVHRRTIALNAMHSFETLMPNKTMGIYSGSVREVENDYLFSTVQTISKPEVLQQFDPEYFDYIIIDEVHRAGASSYQRLLEYFKPKFLLGMTATPERTDGYDIYKLFNYHIAYDIRLEQAMEYDLLCPFHYCGIADFTIDGKEVDDTSTFSDLVSEVRMDHVFKQIETYGYSGDKVHGLVFVSRKDEAREIANIFNQRGYKAIALTGEDNETDREVAMSRLESNDGDYLDYIVTVDIFNEGIDIPCVNQVVMLRPTESAIIFIQQLGRGLRKHHSKDYVVILDFIGNYSKNFFIPMALSNDNSYSKEHYREFINEKVYLLPGTSTVSFDEISKQRIFKAIDAANFSDIKYIKEAYQLLKHQVGHIPTIKDFEDYHSIDIQRIFKNNSLRSYYKFLVKYEKEYKIRLTDEEDKYIEFLSYKLSEGKRIQEIEAIQSMIENKKLYIEDFKNTMLQTYNVNVSEYNLDTVMNILNQNFQTGTGAKTYEQYKFDQHFIDLIYSNPEFKEMVEELIAYSKRMYIKNYTHRYKDTDLCLYQRYTYEDVCRLLNFDKGMVALNLGVYFYDAHSNTLPVWINYDKAEGISESINYHDHFIDNETLIAMSKSNRRIDSDEINKFRNAYKNNTAIHLFVRKNKDDKDSKEFYYLGLMYVQDITEETLDNKPICRIEYKLDQPVRKDLYDYITLGAN